MRRRTLCLSHHTSDAVEALVASLRQRSAPVNIIKSYAHDLHLFVQVASPDLLQVSAETVQTFLASFDQLSVSTRRRRYSTLCAFYHWLMRHGVVENNPMERLDPIEHIEREPRPLPPETVTKILQVIPNPLGREDTNVRTMKCEGERGWSFCCTANPHITLTVMDG